MSVGGDGGTIERDAQIIAHGLNPLMIAALEPRQNRIARKVIRPTFKRCRHFDTQLRCLVKDRRAWIWREDIRPELGARKLPADIHHEGDCFAALLWAFSRKTENNVEGGDYARSHATLGGLIDVAKNLEIFVHQLHDRGRSGFDSLANLMQPRTAQQRQFADTETGCEIGCGLDTPLESRTTLDEALGDLERSIQIDEKVVIGHPEQFEPVTPRQFDRLLDYLFDRQS